MADSWDAEWNSLTQTYQVMIDNDREQYERVVCRALQLKGSREESRVILAQYLQVHYGDVLVSRYNPASKLFFRSLVGSLLNEVIGLVNWHGLAEHYLQIASERHAKE